MQPSEIRTLYAYNTWANNRILDTAVRLSPDQLLAHVGVSFPSVLATLAHTIGAQALYLARCRDDMPIISLDVGQFSDLATLHAAWARVDDETHRFVWTLDEADLGQVIMYVNEGGTWRYPMWQILTHQVNHATQHRSEAAVMLTQFGHSPGWLDFLIYIDGQQADFTRASS